jgi:polyketide biosynthesis acyl carrier protein
MIQTKEQIIQLIKENLQEIIPELEEKEIPEDETIVNLGANSIDRGELITLTLERLNLNISRIEFVNAHTISELAAMIIQKQY